ncbi:hypothetical protein S40288_07811 [Stachybotrys chartarum IBT 40288]|nr:hypothetical protein S40288_07811 [Stachybotrys chartarum IBT 40288]
MALFTQYLSGLPLWLLAISTIPVLLVAVVVYNLFFHPLAHVPGPLLGRATGITNWYHAISGKRHIWLWQQFEMHGSTIRPEPNTVLFRDPAAYAAIYSMKANVRRSKFYTAFRRNDQDNNVLLTVDVAEHAVRRKLLNLAFSEKSNSAAMQFVVRHVDRWHEIMLDQHDSTTDWSAPVNLATPLRSLQFDIMGDFSFGKSFNSMEPGNSPLKANPNNMSAYMRYYYPICRSPLLDILVWLKPRGLDALFNRLAPAEAKTHNDFVHNTVSERLALQKEQASKPESEQRHDIIHFLCEAKNPDTGLPAFGEQDIRSETNLLIIAGTDTTSVSMQGIFFYLSGDPFRSQKLAHEVRSTFASVEEIVHGPKLLSCVYLKACIDEGMRLTPPGPCETPREVLPGGLMVNGQFYPEGTVVGTVPWCNSRDNDVFGDAGVFRPERWIVNEEAGVTKELVQKQKAGFNPFLSGPGNCAGKNLALSELMIVVARTMYRFEIRRAPGSTIGLGNHSLGWGARDKTQLQLVDVFTSLAEGPVVQYRTRGPK